MCGICGILHFEQQRHVDQQQLIRMRDCMTYRGPDDAGIFLDQNAGLGSRRLSILDLSPAGHMPMSSPEGRYHIAYNGEAYNFQELRSSLQSRGVTFLSNTDTEVILQLYMDQGPGMLSRLNGMFALAIWDSRDRRLFLARDRCGVKPLFYTVYQNSLYFASEEKALFAAGVPARFDTTSWDELLCFRFVAGERTPYMNVCRLLPGHFLVLQDGQIQIQCWWHLAEAASRDPLVLNRSQAAEEFRQLFQESISLRRISDVPLGTLLSGGLDSGAMTAELAKQAGRNVASFTVRFTEQQYDEGPLARSVAQRWELDHHELYVLEEEVPSLLEEATRLLDEPIVHGNDIDILAISRYAKPLVTVLLSGEGADEVLGGYVRYRLFLYSSWFGLMRPCLKLMNKVFSSYGRGYKAQQVLSFSDRGQQVMFNSAEVFPAEIGLNPDGNFAFRRSLVEEAQRIYSDPVRQAMFYDQSTYLQSVLDRNDRMTMGASIECREPFLDYRILEWAARVSNSALFHAGIGKYALRAAYKDALPPEITTHKKWGFAVPLGKYFRTVPVLREQLLELSRKSFLESSPFPPSSIQNIVDQFLNGNDHYLPLVRQLLLIAIWHEICIDGKTGLF